MKNIYVMDFNEMRELILNLRSHISNLKSQVYNLQKIKRSQANEIKLLKEKLNEQIK